MIEVVFIVFLSLLNLIIRIQDVTTIYSQNEQRWICQTLTILIYIFSGFTIFRAVTIDVSSSSSDFIMTLTALIVFQLTMNITFIIIQYDGMMAEYNIVRSEGYETKNGMPESELLHLTRYTVQIFGIVISIMLFLFVTFVTVFALTVGVLSRDGNLGSASIMNR